VILLRLPPHSTHFLQPLDVVIFQQWKHWHTEAIDHAVRHGVGEFDRQTFLANLESIRRATFKEGNIKSAFRKCGFWPFRPVEVLCQINVNNHVLGNESAVQEEVTDTEGNNDLPENWSTPQTHDELKQQASAIQAMMRSSVSPPDTPTRQQNRSNIKKFMETVLAKDILHKQLTSYMWDSKVAQVQAERRKKAARTQIQKGGIVYAGDVNRDISNIDELCAKWETNLPTDEKVYLLVLRTTVLPQLLLRTKERRQVADRIAVNCIRRAARANKKRKHADIE
jgi:hypothetical protein